MKKSLFHPLAVITIVLLGLVPLAGCGPTPTAAPTPTEVPTPTSPPPTPTEVVKSADYPDYYPAEYEQIVQASKEEDPLLVYSVMAEYNWKPVLEAFNELYPWIEVETLDLGGELFERYYAETATDAQTADLMITADPSGWLEFVKNKGEAVDYESPERSKLPDWSMPLPGLYTMSTDPMIILYNEQLLPENLRPTGLTHLAELAAANPEVFDGKITTYDVTIPFSFAINWSFVRDRGEETWETLEILGPMTLPEQSGGAQLQKLTSGEYVVSYFMSSGIFPKLPDLEGIVGWNYIGDGTPLFLRGMAIPKGSTNINCAKLMLDFILSHDGQVAWCKGGFTPYRPGLTADDCPRTFQTIAEAIGGEDKIVLVNYDENAAPGRDAFVERWNEAFGR